MQEHLVAISNQQLRCHQPEAIGGTGDEDTAHDLECLKGGRAVNPRRASTDANSASKGSPDRVAINRDEEPELVVRAAITCGQRRGLGGVSPARARGCDDFQLPLTGRDEVGALWTV
jgi:hypothetical protein